MSDKTDEIVMSEKSLQEDLESLSFEQAMAELEQVVQKLQRSDLSLDQSMVLFQRGTYLVGVCQKLLSDAEQEVKVLLEKADGSVTEANLDTEEV